MTEHNRTNEPQTVVAEVIDFFPERGFGFAICYDLRDDRGPRKIFFHVSACRKVGGTPKKPELTNKRVPHGLAIDPNDRYQQRSTVLMRVIEGDRGPKAVAWGMPPKRTIVTDLMEDGGVKRFVGGHVTAFDVRQKHDFVSGTVEAVELVPGCLQLEITDAVANGFYVHEGRASVEVQLYEAHSAPCGDTEYTIVAPAYGYTTRVTFRLPA